MHEVEQLLDLRLAEPGHGRVRAHAARVRPGVVVADPLEVLCGSESEGPPTVGQGEHGNLLTLEQLLDNDVASEIGCPTKARVQLVVGATDEDTLARGKTVGFDDTRRPCDCESACRGHPGRLEHLLREPLRAFDPRRGARGPEDGETRMAQRVSEPGHERGLGPDDDEIDGKLATEGEQTLRVLGAHRVTLAQCRYSGVSGCCVETVEAGASRQC